MACSPAATIWTRAVDGALPHQLAVAIISTSVFLPLLPAVVGECGVVIIIWESMKRNGPSLLALNGRI